MMVRKSYRVSENDFKVIEEKAKLSNMKTSEYVRISALQKVILVKNAEEFRNLIFEINKIGTNINQLVKLSNTVGSVDKNDVIKIQESLVDIYKALSKL